MPICAVFCWAQHCVPVQASERDRYIELLGMVIVETLQAFGLVAGSAAESDKYRRNACRKLQVRVPQLALSGMCREAAGDTLSLWCSRLCC